ncbi:MAG: carbon starvation protein A [Lachnospiraceae bacterium]|nr:carbon starvation protein A [Lachnospiraceae bacterium]
MITFLIGLFLLLAGGAIYGRFCERIFRPDSRETPAVRLNDGVDYVPMKKWKNSLIQLLNIAGTGPILGPIQGILFGPIAFLTIPIGCVLGGAFHDYMSGMISLRNDGAQMPSLIRRYLGKHTYLIYNLFVCLLMLLVGAVFIYTPGDLFLTQILKTDNGIGNPVLWLVYGAIFVYYIVATLFPIDKIIGKIYPIFGGILILSAIGVWIGLFVKGYPLDEIWDTGVAGLHPQGLHFIPVFFVTVACGIVSGFHSTQATLIARTTEHEKEGRMTFYNMMIVEGLIAMIWAAAAMGVMKLGLADAETSPTEVVGIVAKHLLGSVGGIVAIIGVIVLPITSGDTALRSLRLMTADALQLDQSKKKNRLALSLVIFVVVAALLLFSKMNAGGFNILWRYFAWANQTIAVFAFAMIAVYMQRKKQPYVLALVPGMFYMFVISSFILNAAIGFHLSWTLSYVIGGVLTVVYAWAVLAWGRNYKEM